MKKNFLVTTGLIDAWEPNENNFILGKWCEFYNYNIFDDNKIQESILKNTSIVKNTYHWDNPEKKNKDYKYLQKSKEEILSIVSEKLSKIHNLNEESQYWRIIIDCWLSAYSGALFERWGAIQEFFKKNVGNEFYSNSLPINSFDYIPKNQQDYVEKTQIDEWNHFIYLRILEFLNFKNLKLIKKKRNILKENNSLGFTEKDYKFLHSQNIPLFPKVKNLPLISYLFQVVDSIIANFAFKYNKVIIEYFHFPKFEFFKLCLKCKLIPSKYISLFNFKIESSKKLIESEKRKEFRNSLSGVNYQDQFINFVLLNIHKDIPKSYIEDFGMIRKKILPKAKQKKIIFSMFSAYYNDNFKIYLAEAKKHGTKVIFSRHGGGQVWQDKTFINQEPYFNHLMYIADGIIKWDKDDKSNYDGVLSKKFFFVNLSPTLPIIKFKRKKPGIFCSIVFFSAPAYCNNFFSGPGLSASIEHFNLIENFVKNLNPQIQSKIKFRLKEAKKFSPEKRFAKTFGEKSFDRPSQQNSFIKTLQNSKLIIVTAPQTAFLEALYSNTPTILICNESEWQFSNAPTDYKSGAEVLNILKENKIAFTDYKDALNHVNKNWDKLDLWWDSENVQSARDTYLKSYFNVSPDWYKEWSDYVNFLLSME